MPRAPRPKWKRKTPAPAAAPPAEVVASWFPDAETAKKATDLPMVLVLDTDELWGKVRQPWQDAAHRMVLGLDPDNIARRLVWIDGPTGSGKDQIIAAACLSVLHYAPRGFRVIMLSTDHDRSKDVIETTRGFCRRAADTEGAVPVGAGITFTRDAIRNEERDVQIKCVATDGASASGERADLFICNEVQSWADPHGHRVWTESLARYGKRKKGRFIVLSNLPFTGKGDWRRDVWEKARKGERWSYLPVRLADCPWITPEYIEDQRANLPSIVFRRLYECEPTDGRGELVTLELIQRATFESLAQAAPPPAGPPNLPGWRWCGVDLGIARDHAVAVVMRADPGGAVFLERIDVWVPDPSAADAKDREVQVAEVEARLIEYGIGWRCRLMLDPYQAVQMQQNLEARGCQVERVDATPKNLQGMAEAVISLFRDGRVRLYPDAGRTEISADHVTTLAQQLLDAELKEQERGVRIVSRRTKAGHGDQASAFALAAFGVVRTQAIGVPVCVGSGSGAADGKRPSRRENVRTHRHSGRFLGTRTERRRVTA